MLAAITTATLTTAGCSNVVADEAAPKPTIGSEAISPIDQADAAAASALTISAEDWTEDEPVDGPLPPDSSAARIKLAVEDAHGRTNDVAEEMSRFVAFPRVPTPDRAELTELRADVRTSSDGAGYTIVSEITFVADGSPTDIVELYQADLTGLGWLVVKESEQVLNGTVAQHLDFEIPDSAYDRHDFELQVRDATRPTGLTPRSEIRLRFVELTSADRDTTRKRFVGWAGDLPLPEGGVVTGAGIQTSSIGRHSLHYSLALTFDGTGPAQLAGQVRSSLPTTDYQLDQRPQSGDATDDWVYLSSPFFADSRVSTHQVPLDANAPTVVTIDARVEFTPSS